MKAYNSALEKFILLFMREMIMCPKENAPQTACDALFKKLKTMNYSDDFAMLDANLHQLIQMCQRGLVLSPLSEVGNPRYVEHTQYEQDYQEQKQRMKKK